MSTYKQITQLDWNDVQSLCIERNWYTRGTNTEYLNMQAIVHLINEMDDERWTAQLQEIAEDIKWHSETDYEVADIMTAVGMKCRRWFKEV